MTNQKQLKEMADAMLKATYDSFCVKPALELLQIFDMLASGVKDD